MLGQGEALPRVICSDRGPGFYQSSTGHIVGAYKEAAKQHGFRPYAGDDASLQPPDIPDVLLHETAVASARFFQEARPEKERRASGHGAPISGRASGLRGARHC